MGTSTLIQRKMGIVAIVSFLCLRFGWCSEGPCHEFGQDFAVGETRWAYKAWPKSEYKTGVSDCIRSEDVHSAATEEPGSHGRFHYRRSPEGRVRAVSCYSTGGREVAPWDSWVESGPRDMGLTYTCAEERRRSGRRVRTQLRVALKECPFFLAIMEDYTDVGLNRFRRIHRNNLPEELLVCELRGADVVQRSRVQATPANLKRLRDAGLEEEFP